MRVLGLAALAWWLVRRPWRERGLSAVEGTIVAWAVADTLAAAWAPAPRIGFEGDAFQNEGALTSWALAGLALASRDALADDRTRARTLGVALAAAAAACAYALIQVGGFDPLPWSRTATYGEHFVRPFGTLGHPNLLGVVSAAACAWAASIVLRSPERRWWSGPVALLAALATVLTFSRAAWLGLAAGLIVVLAGVVADRSRPRPAWRVVAVGVLVGAGVVALFALGGWSRLFATRAAEFGRAGGETGASRVEIWTSALAMWRERPWLGQGPDAFELAFPRFQTPRYWRIEWAGIPFHAHSIYLHTLATRGVVGVAAALALALAAAWAAWRAWRARVGARDDVVRLVAVAISIAVAGLAGAIGVNGALWLLLAVVALDAIAAGARSATAARNATLAVAVAIAVGAGAALWAYRGLGASHDLAYAGGPGRRDPAGALAAATHAIALRAGDDRAHGALCDAWLGLAAARRDPGTLAEAERAIRRALARVPSRSLHWQRLGTVHAIRASAGDTAALAPMRDAYGRAVALAPYNVLPSLEHARWEIVLGHPERAIAPARDAVALYPDEALPRTTLASALLATGRRAEAARELQRAMQGHWRPQEADRSVAADVLRELEARRGK